MTDYRRNTNSGKDRSNSENDRNKRGDDRSEYESKNDDCDCNTDSFTSHEVTFSELAENVVDAFVTYEIEVETIGRKLFRNMKERFEV